MEMLGGLIVLGVVIAVLILCGKYDSGGYR